MPPPIAGFWLPKEIRPKILSPSTPFIELSFSAGQQCDPHAPKAVIVRWPVLSHDQWKELLAMLRANRLRLPAGQPLWKRLELALRSAARRLVDPSDPLHQLALASLPAYTGYSAEMLHFTLGALDLFALEQMPLALSRLPTRAAARDWQAMPGLPGRLRFYPANALQKSASALPGLSSRPLHGAPLPVELVVGYGAGNVPGTALLVTFLALATALSGAPPPATLIKNSRSEPIFGPLVLEALEQADPELVSCLALLVWDYAEEPVQDFLLAQADLVLAAASDETISLLETQIDRAARLRRRPIRFHPHGHKVSFTAIAREILSPGTEEHTMQVPLLEQVSLLAALDSAFWDQHGCLSARLHFVESSVDRPDGALDYAAHLATAMRLLAHALPRGAWPRQPLHDCFDRYKQLEANGQAVTVFSNYEDEFLVVVDRRPVDRAAFYGQVNECQGRVVIVRPVERLDEIPERYLRFIPPSNLQSLSVAVGAPGSGLEARFLRFAAACGARGVTAIRTVGRGAFPQLAYSWDGLMPLDLLHSRPAGCFTTIEFDDPWEEIQATYNLLKVTHLAPMNNLARRRRYTGSPS